MRLLSEQQVLTALLAVLGHPKDMRRKVFSQTTEKGPRVQWGRSSRQSSRDTAGMQLSDKAHGYLCVILSTYLEFARTP